MNRRAIIIGVVIVAVLGTGAYLWYTNEHPAPLVNQQQAATTPLGATDTAKAPLHTIKHGAYYDIDTVYPASVPVTGSAGAVALMKGFEQDTIAQFMKDGNFANLTPQDIQIQGLGPDKKYSLKITYQTYRSTHAVSYVYTVYKDTLGAHPNATYRTFTFDSTSGTSLNLSDIFTPGSDYLGTLSTKARALLPALIAKREGIKAVDVDRKMLNDGTAPNLNNFSAWYVDGTNLVIIFPPYQVAAYAAGEQQVSIPLSKLGSLLSDTYK